MQNSGITVGELIQILDKIPKGYKVSKSLAAWRSVYLTRRDIHINKELKEVLL